MVFPLIDSALRGMAIALLLLLAVLLQRDGPGNWPSPRIWVVFMLTLCVQVVASAPAVEHGLPAAWQAPLVALSLGNAVLFWVVVQSLFQDDFRLRPGHVAAWLAALAVGAVHCLDTTPAASTFHQADLIALRAIPIISAMLAAVAAAADWRSDLVPARRTLRKFILLTGLGYTLVMVALRLTSGDGMLSTGAAGFDVSALLVILAVVTLKIVQRSALSDPSLPSAPGAPASSRLLALAARDPADDRLVATLKRVMIDERAYRLDNLSVATLAQRLAVPEYRLRRVINQRLGHRNFNAYVNGLRLDDAIRVLSDPDRDGESIMTIALDVGFQSIGPFNRAFKARCGVTPSEFRRLQLADSSNRPAEDDELPVSARRVDPGRAS